jgi:hypothetical protein
MGLAFLVKLQICLPPETNFDGHTALAHQHIHFLHNGGQHDEFGHIAHIWCMFDHLRLITQMLLRLWRHLMNGHALADQ